MHAPLENLRKTQNFQSAAFAGRGYVHD